MPLTMSSRKRPSPSRAFGQGQRRPARCDAQRKISRSWSDCQCVCTAGRASRAVQASRSRATLRLVPYGRLAGRAIDPPRRLDPRWSGGDATNRMAPVCRQGDRCIVQPALLFSRVLSIVILLWRSWIILSRLFMWNDVVRDGQRATRFQPSVGRRPIPCRELVGDKRGTGLNEQKSVWRHCLDVVNGKRMPAAKVPEVDMMIVKSDLTDHE